MRGALSNPLRVEALKSGQKALAQRVEQFQTAPAYGLPQLEAEACLRIAWCWAAVTRPSLNHLAATDLTAFTYSPWFFQGPSHGRSCFMLHPSGSTIAPGGVSGHSSSESGTPSWSLSD